MEAAVLEDAAIPYNPDPSDTPELIVAAEERFLPLEGVTGVGFGNDAVGGDALVIYVLDKNVAATLPSRFRDLPVVTVVTGPIEAQ